ncbi:type I restriction endonuclease subunit R [Nocardiopsis metallicus]|uniref:Type I restriction enzyme endonuclease subunit n=1 Tax=Nocardiopsis metallicus TaxID=179819 RepID=A0A840WRL0_9ACTN|nr:HsdR family type I site-specific deoxyribonuclease [Nocardiopsis metallicus]MBB5495661.1 type I restriction enzyme R subunit [Nocardiopsis metallicus]
MDAPEGSSPNPSAPSSGPSGKQPTGPEWELTEKPLIDQLITMGWTLDTGHGKGSGRSSYTQTLLELPLRSALRRINLDDDGREWLDESRIEQAVSALTRPQARTLIEINEELTGLLLVGTEVDGVEGWHGGRRQSVRFIDFDDVDNNDFRIARHFVLDGPGAPGTDRIIPDLVLFVNGIPLVVIECKSPDANSPMATAIDQLRRYADQRSEVRAKEGNAKLFHTNQFVIAAQGTNARAAGFTAGPEHFMEWKTTEPATPEQVAAELDLRVSETSGPDAAKNLNGQQTLVAGMLRPAILLDLVRHFTLFMEPGTRRVKAVARYQQYRAVHRAIRRMATQPTRLQHGEFDQRGGIVWHTQGSGKSLTMVFLVRAMRSHPQLTAFKIIVVTDRTQLQGQLSETMALSGESTKTIEKVRELESTLAVPGKGLYFAMIHKYRGDGAVTPEGSASDGEASDEEAPETGTGKEKKEIVPQLDVADDSTDILVLVDEAHRSQGSQLHANLMGALPNAVRVGFTGTPIIMGDKDRFTSKIFGAFIDSYTIKQSEADGATVPILYEGRTTKAHVRDGNDLDELFVSMLDATPEQLEELKRRYATKNNVLEAEQMIAAKAASMLRHYVDVILPNGFKAQVVAVSRKAAVRYQAALLVARDELVAEIDALPAELRTPEAAEDPEAHGAATARLIRALPHRDLIARLDAAAVISGAHNDSADWKAQSKEWTNETKHRNRIREFKKPLPLGTDSDPENTSPLAFLVVNSMLLTGFDAPGEQILYLDRHIKEAELLQAIARVNRTAQGKQVGYVIDYYGVAEHLKTALAAYAAEDIEGALSSVRNEVPLLRERHERVRKIFTVHGLDRFDTEEEREECVQLLADESRRREFRNALKDFNRSLETVLPRPEAREFVPDAKSFGAIATLARSRYREGDGFDPSLYGGKVRDLIDQYIRVHDIRTKIPPTAITASDFESKVEALSSDRAKASEMEHALRHHISENLDQDPEHYGKLSERLDEILDRLDGNWAQMYEAMRDLRTDMAEGRQSDDTGLDPNTEAPFYDLLATTIRNEETGELAPELREVLVDFTRSASRDMRAAIALRGYGDIPGRNLRKKMTKELIRVKLAETRPFPMEVAKELGPRLVDLAERKFDHG